MSIFKKQRTPGASYVPDNSGYEPPDLMKAFEEGKIKPPPKVTEKPVPTQWRSEFSFEWFRHFTFWERVKIAFGCNLVVMIGVATQHSPGKYQPLVIGNVSHDSNATEHMKHVCQNLLAERSSKSPEAVAAELNLPKTNENQKAKEKR
jgi:hypothetical protein